MRIGVYDSGVGGMFLSKELTKNFKKFEILNYIDSENFPLGIKTKKKLVEILKNIIKKFENENVDFLVIACNTMSEIYLSNEFKTELKIIDVISLAIRETKTKNDIRVINLMATQHTVESRIYQKFLDEKFKIINTISTKLINDIETQKDNYEEIKNKMIDIINKEINQHNFDTLLLGCTHFLLFQKDIEKTFNSINIITPTNKLIEYFNNINDNR